MLLSVTNLHKSYNNQIAIKDISFNIKQGEIVGLVGENGAGKTTTIKSILKLIKSDSGSISFEGKIYDNIFDIENKITYIPDEPVLYEELSCFDNINFIGRVFHNNKNDFDNLSNELITMFNFEEYLHKYPTELSKGNKQKLMIILGGLQKFKLLIADEPFTGLDPIQIKTLKEYFKKLRENGCSVMLSTHLLDIAESICDKVIIIDKNTVAEEGNLYSLLEKYNATNLEEIYLKIKGGN